MFNELILNHSYYNIYYFSSLRIFGLITKPQAKSSSSEVHLFVELDPDQPAIAIVDFINRYLIPSKADINSKN